jgi:hypothetical protein
VAVLYICTPSIQYNHPIPTAYTFLLFVSICYPALFFISTPLLSFAGENDYVIHTFIFLINIVVSTWTYRVAYWTFSLSPSQCLVLMLLLD